MSYIPRESLEALVEQRGKELDRLRAEVERLQHINQNLLKQKDGVDKDLFGTVCFERDEALAQVAVLGQAIELLLAPFSGRYREGDPLERELPAHQQVGDLLQASRALINPPAEARALLDRLQRAEHVASYMLWKYKDDPSADEKALLVFESWQQIEVLAAWEAEGP